MKTELWKKRQARSGFRPDPQQLSAACQMFRRDANVGENKSVAGSRSPPGRHAAARGSAPREAGTELQGGRGRFLPPGIVLPGSPGLTPAACYFCSKVLSGVNTSPPALGTFLCTGPCQGHGPASAAGARPRVRASARAPVQPSRSRPAAVGGRIWEGRSGAATWRPGKAGSWQGGHEGLQHRGCPSPSAPAGCQHRRQSPLRGQHRALAHAAALLPRPVPGLCWDMGPAVPAETLHTPGSACPAGRSSQHTPGPR